MVFWLAVACGRAVRMDRRADRLLCHLDLVLQFAAVGLHGDLSDARGHRQRPRRHHDAPTAMP